MLRRPVPLLLSLLALAGCAAPGPLALRGTSAPGEQAPFLAGYADVPFTPPKGYPLGGYGGGARREEFPLWLGIGWPGRLALAAHLAWHEEGPEPADLLVGATGAHDEVSARAVVLRPEGQAPLAIVRLDAIGTTAELHDRVVAGVRDLGYAPERVLLCATHTHSGPGSFFRAPFACLVGTDVFRPEIEARMAEAAIAAVRQAHERARPATLSLARARDRGPDGRPLLAKNRRSGRFREEISPDDVDDEVHLLLLREKEGGAPLALLLNYAVHPTVLGTDNLGFSGDLGHGLEEGLAARLGAPALFLNGAEGDVGPRSLSQAGGLLRCRELGEAFAALVLPALEGAPAQERIAIGAAWGEQDMGDPWTCLAAGRARFLDGDQGLAAWLTAPLALPGNALLWLLGFTDLRLALTWNLAAGVVLDLDGLLHRTTTRVAGVRLRAGEEDLALLTLPGEPTHDVGQALKAQATERGATRVLVLGLALDHLGYLASEQEYRRGGYEAWSTLFGPGAAARLLAAQATILDALGWAGPAAGVQRPGTRPPGAQCPGTGAGAGAGAAGGPETTVQRRSAE